MTIQEDCFALIDHKLIENSQRSLLAARAKFVTACADLEVATAKHTEAKAFADACVAGGGGDAQLLCAAADETQRRLKVCQRVVSGADDAVREATANLETSKSIGLRPVYTAGVKLRLSASRKGDTARAMLAEAESEYKTATQILNLATSQGAQHVVFDASHHHQLTTLADERRRWSENTHHAWWPGLDSDGNVIEPKAGV